MSLSAAMQVTILLGDCRNSLRWVEEVLEHSGELLMKLTLTNCLDWRLLGDWLLASRRGDFALTMWIGEDIEESFISRKLFSFSSTEPCLDV